MGKTGKDWRPNPAKERFGHIKQQVDVLKMNLKSCEGIFYKRSVYAAQRYIGKKGVILACGLRFCVNLNV